MFVLTDCRYPVLFLQLVYVYVNINGVFTRSSKRPAIHVYLEYICWKFAGHLLDRVNTL